MTTQNGTTLTPTPAVALPTAGPTFTEAPASVTLKVAYRGYSDILFTLRDASGIGLLEKLDRVMDKFALMGIAPAIGLTHGPAAPQSPGGGAICPEHGTPMKQGKKGLYCPAVVTEVQGRKIYCNHTA